MPKGICDRCGFEYDLAQLKKEWTGYMVCRDCFDHRHPQEAVRGVRDQQGIPGARPALTPVYLEINEVTADDL